MDVIAVEFDIGGTIFKTTRESLSGYPKSLLAQEAKTERTFFDRDPTHFRYILNFFRDGPRVVLPSDRRILEELNAEALFYKLPEFQHIIKDNFPVSFRILCGKGTVYEFTDRVSAFSKREKNSKLALMARDHGESGMPIYLRKKDIPHFSLENFQVVLEFLKFGATKLAGENRRQLQTMSVDFLEYWGLHVLIRHRHHQHEDRVRRLSHLSSLEE